MAIGKASKTGNVGKPARRTGPIGKGKGRSGSKYIENYTGTVQKSSYPTTTTVTTTTV